MSKEISYSDGEIENEILQTLKESSNVSAAATIAIEKQTSWAFEYHLSCQRANLVRHFNFQGKRVLEIGAGMGAVSRYVAEKCEFLQIVEGTSRRLSCLQERLRDLRNFNVFCGNFKDFKVEEKFDVILIIGVLEYADLYFEDDGEDPFVAFLKKAKSHLKPEGEVLLAIENRLGLKYWAGATEDHTGAFFDGILGYRNAKTVRTFSKKEIRTVLESAGFLEVNFQYPFPDYKLPRSILTEELANRCPDVFASIAGASLARDYGRDRVVLFSESVGFNGLIDTGLLTEFSNSFLIISRQNKILKKDKVLGYSYSQNELKKTMTHFEEINDSLMVNKRLMDSDADEVDYQTIRWIRPQATEVKRGALLIDRFKRSLTFREWEIFFEEWKKYVSWI
ncbi:MAG TPA: class I SAM-dependent methyltransferase, partial [Pseudobdellovibrionaceae bacterium]